MLNETHPDLISGIPYGIGAPLGVITNAEPGISLDHCLMCPKQTKIHLGSRAILYWVGWLSCFGFISCTHMVTRAYQ